MQGRITEETQWHRSLPLANPGVILAGVRRAVVFLSFPFSICPFMPSLLATVIARVSTAEWNCEISFQVIAAFFFLKCDE
jgi:hypothetical protein